MKKVERKPQHDFENKALNFFLEAAKLKDLKRRGWVVAKVKGQKVLPHILGELVC